MNECQIRKIEKCTITPQYMLGCDSALPPLQWMPLLCSTHASSPWILRSTGARVSSGKCHGIYIWLCISFPVALLNVHWQWCQIWKWHCCTVNMHASNQFFFILVFIFESRVVQTDLYLLELLILPLHPKCWDYRSILLCLASSMLGTKFKAQCLLDKVPYQLSYVPGPFFIHQCHGRGKWKQTIVMDSGNPNTQEAETGEWWWVQW